MGEVDHLVRQLQISRFLAHLLVKRGLTELEEAETFLKPALKGLSNPLKLTNLEQAANRILKGVRENDNILILGDYDVDGVTSTTLLVSFLKIFGSLPRFVVPRRLEEGYGMSRQLLDRAISEEKPDLFIALDCGTNSVEEVAYLRKNGIEVVVVDHHQSTQEESADCILVNPHVLDPEDSPWRDLCSVGLTFKLVHGIVKILRDQGNEEAHQIQLKDYLDLVALGTIADLVPLRKENRILVRHGLRRLRQSPRCGIQALFQVSGLGIEGKDLRATDISFRLGPRINASGRLADATLPIEMLLSDNFQTSIVAARQLDEMNTERQKIERDIVLEAEQLVNDNYEDAHGVVVFNESWHPGVVGIVASRLTNILKKPAIVLGAEGSIAKGSGRSIPGLDLVQALNSAESLLADYGGHPMAVGLSLEQKDLADFRVAFNQAVLDQIGKTKLEETLDIECWVQPEDIGYNLLSQLDQLQPFGQGNPEPVLGARFLELAYPPQAFGVGGKNFRFFHFNNEGERVSAIAWNLGSRIPPPKIPIDIAFKFAWNYYNGTSSPQMEIVDWRFSQ